MDVNFNFEKMKQVVVVGGADLTIDDDTDIGTLFCDAINSVTQQLVERKLAPFGEHIIVSAVPTVLEMRGKTILIVTIIAGITQPEDSE